MDLLQIFSVPETLAGVASMQLLNDSISCDLLNENKFQCNFAKVVKGGGENAYPPKVDYLHFFYFETFPNSHAKTS